MANCLPKELNKQEQRIVNDIMQRSNLNLEDATTIARTIIEWGYTIHEQDYNRLKIALDILKNGFEVILCENDFPISEIKYSIGFKFNNDGVWIHISQEEFELLKNVLEGEEDGR